MATYIILRKALTPSNDPPPYCWLGYGAWVDDPRAAIGFASEEQAKLLASEWNGNAREQNCPILHVAIQREG